MYMPLSARWVLSHSPGTLGRQSHQLSPGTLGREPNQASLMSFRKLLFFLKFGVNDP